MTDLQHVAWMSGPWRGQLGERQIEEHWSGTDAGVLSTMVRLISGGQVELIELIAMREEQDGLVLHLRQFTPELQPVLTQDMHLVAHEPDYVQFAGPADSPVHKLSYRRENENTMTATITTPDGTELVAGFHRLV